MHAAEKSVTIYTTPSCSYCKLAKQFFAEHQIAYKEIDVAADATRAQEMITKSGQMGVPVIEIGSDIVIGFDRSTLARLLSIR